MPDVVWNPFQSFEYSEISFKSVFISCSMNLALFVLKPFLSSMMRGIRRRICVTSDHDNETMNENINHDIEEHKVSNYQRCSSVYKRPYLHWVA